MAELARGKSARAIGNLVQALTLLKGQPLAYNRDLQEDKEPLFDSVDTLLATLGVMAAMLPSLRFDAERGRAAATAGYALATDLADHLAQRGVPFREAHVVVGALVAAVRARGPHVRGADARRVPRGAPGLRRGDRGAHPGGRARGAQRARGHGPGRGGAAASGCAYPARGRARTPRRGTRRGDGVTG